MQTVNHIRSLIIVVLVLLIFAPTVSVSCDRTDTAPVIATTSHYTKQSSNHSKNEIQLPYEEREKEEEKGGEEKSKQSFVYILSLDLQVEIPASPISFQKSLTKNRPSANVPIYLRTRSLVI